MSIPRNPGPCGLEDAIARYGNPVEHAVEIPVSLETLNYWRDLKDGRTAEVVLLIRRRNGCYLLHTKTFYPEGIYRLPTGGIHAGEDLIEAARREAVEETGLDVAVERFLGVLRHRFVHGEQEFHFTSYLIELVETGGTLRAQDEDENISGYRDTTIEGLEEAACQLESLTGRWRDWGTIRAAAHRLAARLLREGAKER